MTLTTLNYIHSLLMQEEEIRRRAKNLAIQSLHQAEKEQADNIPTLQSVSKKVQKSWQEAFDALHDFENQEW